MSNELNADRCFAFIGCQINPPPHAHYASQVRPNPTVTISRQTGSGAMDIASRLAVYLQARAPGPRGVWTVFDKNLVEKVLEEHNLPKELAKFMPENRVSAIQDMVEEVLGLHPPSWTLLRQTTETILHLAELGNVILVGRAANVVTRQMKNAFHVRLVAPLEKRVEQVVARGKIGREDALDFIKREDLGRRRYLKDYFKADIDDIMLYDMVVNTGRIPPQEAAQLIGDAIIHWAQTL